MKRMKRIATSDLDYLQRSTLFGYPLAELIERGLRGTPYDGTELAEVLRDRPQEPLYKEVSAPGSGTDGLQRDLARGGFNV